MINQLTIKELEKWQLDGRDFLLVDVREKWEREEFSLGGEHIPLNTVSKKSDLFKEKTVVFYCRKGIRSQLAIQRLSQTIDVAKFYNLAGGVLKVTDLPTRWGIKK